MCGKRDGAERLKPGTNKRGKVVAREKRGMANQYETRREQPAAHLLPKGHI